MAGRQIPDAIVQAAIWWVVELQRSDSLAAWALFRTTPTYRQLTASQFQLAYEWLQEIGVVDGGELLDPTSARATLFSNVISASDPLWITSAIPLDELAEDLPLDVVALADDLALSTDSVLDSLQLTRRKFDAARLAEIGLRGEILLVELLRGYAGVTVHHLSLLDDSLGYDARATGRGHSALIEIKATTGVADRFFLSRNEFERMKKSDDWCLQLVHLADDRISSMSFTTSEWLAAVLPSDSSDAARWNSAYVEIPQIALGEGLHPRIKSVLRG